MAWLRTGELYFRSLGLNIKKKYNKYWIQNTQLALKINLLPMKGASFVLFFRESEIIRWEVKIICTNQANALSK